MLPFQKEPKSNPPRTDTTRALSHKTPREKSTLKMKKITST